MAWTRRARWPSKEASRRRVFFELEWCRVEALRAGESEGVATGRSYMVGCGEEDAWKDGSTRMV